ncbi:hypothetical protein HYPBUDRAFT_153841 [Hyphopichia burtonii NRRL Y-1933]|uniref:Uncharacterized protein n=1 Tax=Hyphopichia burtonii NRRL Y-1933 TaxID=984485 RepID=A0A1E4REA9_9ASCO|nr:hypothetical protein HYPBUDRAFT_153841 [Hyphopichia burtonii NRRL Y-1933]ODV65608.1 hypothetical protein HYPBUDRAFT_153841 [Hyphopichia burtonii NRRL Y-1933]
MSSTKKEYHSTDIYQVCNGELRPKANFNFDALFRSPYHKVVPRGRGKYDLYLDKSAPDFNEMFLYRSIPVAPDDVLGHMAASNLKIPIKAREEFPKENQLPSSELLKVLHYYFSEKVGVERANHLMHKSFDETALLSLGMLVEQWVDDLIDDDVMKLFLEKDNTEPNFVADLFDESSESEEESDTPQVGEDVSDDDESETDPMQQYDDDEFVEDLDSYSDRLDANLSDEMHSDDSISDESIDEL